MPFEIPESWIWVRLKTIANIYNGNSINENEKKNKYTNVVGRDFIATKDISFDRNINYNNGINIPYEVTNFKIAPKGKVLLCIEGGSAGRKIALTNKEVCFGNKLACFDSLLINDSYLFYILQSNEFQSIFKSNLSGIIGGVSINNIKEILIPLPPIQEQIRIAEKVGIIEPLILNYNNLENKLSELEKSFPDKLKKSILQIAIEGKLVRQDPADEPAFVLLERIKKEKEQLVKEGKIKRDKNNNLLIQDDYKNYYMNMPENWQLCTIKDVCSYGYTAFSFNPIFGDWLLELEDIESGSSKILIRKKITTDTNMNSKVYFDKNMILYSKLRPYLDKVLIAPEQGVATSEIVPFYSFINSEFLIYFLKSSYFLNRVKNLMYGVKMPRLGTNDMLSTIFFLPPIEEQSRIVYKVTKIFKVID